MILPSEQRGANTNLLFSGISRIVAGKFAVMTTPCRAESINGSFSFIMMLLLADNWQREVGSSASTCSALLIIDQ